MKKLLAMFLAVVMIALTIAACASPAGDTSADDASPASEGGIITFANQQWNEAGTGDFLRMKHQEFTEANPEYTFEEIFFATGELITQMLLAIAAGTPPDLIVWTLSRVGTVINNGDTMPLNDFVSDELVERWKNGDFGAPMQSAPLYTDGIFNAVLYQQSSSQLMVNTLMFEEAGLPIPTTFEEFVNAAIELSDAPHQFGYAFDTIETNTRVFEAFCVWAFGFDPDFQADGYINVNTPGVIEGMTQWKRLFDVPTVPVGMERNAWRSLFGQGGVGMIIDGPWVYASALAEDDNVAEHIIVVPTVFPTGISQGDGGTILIPRGANNPVGAGKFLDLILSRENQELWTNMTMSLGGDNTVTDSFIAANPWFNGYAVAAEGGLIMTRYPENLPDYFEDLDRILAHYVQQIMFEDRDPAEAMAAAQAEIDALIGN